MELHIDYEQQPEYPLEEIEQPNQPWTLRVEKMSLSKDETDLRYNEALTLRGIPPAAFSYRLGNRSALNWVIDQYRVSTDPRSNITNDPNRPERPRRRPQLHPPPHRPGHYRLPRNPTNHRHPPHPQLPHVNHGQLWGPLSTRNQYLPRKGTRLRVPTNATPQALPLCRRPECRRSRND